MAFELNDLPYSHDALEAAGTLKFTVSSTYGDFAHLNSPLDWITLECASCNSGRGMRIVRFADNGYPSILQ